MKVNVCVVSGEDTLLDFDATIDYVIGFINLLKDIGYEDIEKEKFYAFFYANITGKSSVWVEMKEKET